MGQIARRSKRVSSWKSHATNLSTGVAILCGKIEDDRQAGKSKFIYKVKDRLFLIFADAVQATEPYSNIEGACIVIHTHWPSSSDTPFCVYSPKKNMIGKFSSLKQIAEKASAFEVMYPSLSDDKIARRKKAYDDAELARSKQRAKLLEEHKARKIQEQKKIIFQEMADKKTAEKVARRRAEDLEKHGVEEGTW